MPNPPEAGLPNPASYSADAGVVVDNVTKLTWQEPIVATGTCSGGCTQQDAAAYCNGLGSGWRLPTRIELVSLLDYTQEIRGVLIDPTNFPSTTPDCFWTSTHYANHPDNPWFVDFGGGSIAADTAGTMSCHVRCVD